MRNREKLGVAASKQQQTAEKRQSTNGKKMAYENSARIIQKTPKESTSHRHNQFQLIYKIKGSGKTHQQYSEQSFESLIFLKSKNKRFGHHSKRDPKLKAPNAKPDCDRTQKTDMSSTLKRVHKKVDEHKQKENCRLANFLSLERRKTGESRSRGRKNSGDGRRGDGSLKRTKSSEMEMKPQETVDSIRRPVTKIPLAVNKSPRRLNSSKSPTSPKHPSKPSRSSKQHQQSSKRLRSTQRHPIQNPPTSQYIFFGNEIIPAENSALEEEISSLMQQTNPKRLQTKDEKDGNFGEEDLEIIRKYFDEKATVIQRVWRGYLVRKEVRRMVMMVDRAKKKVRDEQALVTPKELRKDVLPIDTPPQRQQPIEAFLFTPSPQSVPSNSKQISKQNSLILQNAPVSLPDKLSSVISEIQKIENPLQQQQVLSKLRSFFKQKQPPKIQIHNEDVNETLKTRENAIDLRLSTQISVLKRLSNEGKLPQGEYDKKLIEAEKWAYTEKQEIDKIKLLLKDNMTRAAEIVKKVHEEMVLVEKVKAGEEDQASLNKVLDNIPSTQTTDNYFFFPTIEGSGSSQRPKSTGCHFGFHKSGDSKQAQQQAPAHQVEHMYNTNLKQFLQQYRQRQKVKSDCDKRIAIQMSYLKCPISQAPTVNTSMQSMHTFLTNFFRFVVYYYKHEFLRFINMPYGYSPERRIKYLQGYEFESEEEEEEGVLEGGGMVEGVEKVIGTEILAEFQQHYYEDRKPSQDKSILLECIHNRAIFDAFNECLNLFRPYFSINGPPYLWNTSQKALTFYFIAEQNIEQVFQKTKYKVMKCASGLCGLLVPEYQGKIVDSKEEMIQLKTNCHKVLGEYRQQRLLKSEKHFIHETDYQWFLFEQEKTETLFELGTMVLDNLVRDLCLDLKRLLK